MTLSRRAFLASVPLALVGSTLGFRASAQYEGIPPWTPPEQPDYAEAIGRWSVDEYLNKLWEPLRLDHAGYVQRFELGPDASGEFVISCYELTPAQFDRTLVITCNLHGAEEMGQLGVNRFLRHVADETDAHPALMWMRRNVRIVVVPIANPWGLTRQTRKNANRVDLNRNFPARWEEWPDNDPNSPTYKGPEPWSEIETRHIRDLVLRYPDATAFMDAHNTAPGTLEWLANIPWERPQDRPLVLSIAAPFMDTGDDAAAVPHTGSLAINWASEDRGLWAVTPEYPAGGWSDKIADREDMFRATRWYGNLAMQYAWKSRDTSNPTVTPTIPRMDYTVRVPMVTR